MLNEQGKRVKVIHVPHGPKQPKRELTEIELEQARHLRERAAEAFQEAQAEKDKIDVILSNTFPDAKSKEVVEMDGKKYQRWYLPELSGRRSRGRPQYIKRWHSGWTELRKEQND